MKTCKSYSDLLKLKTFEERFDYLKIGGEIGIRTFGSSRYLNQDFYHSPLWKKVRNEVIVRDDGCDLGIEGFDIAFNICVHHIIPMTLDDVLNENPLLYDPNNLICASQATHRALHYSKNFSVNLPVERKPGDTKLW